MGDCTQPTTSRHEYAGVSCASHCLNTCEAWCVGEQGCLGVCVDECVPACLAEGDRAAADEAVAHRQAETIQSFEAELASSSPAETRPPTDSWWASAKHTI